MVNNATSVRTGQMQDGGGSRGTWGDFLHGFAFLIWWSRSNWFRLTELKSEELTATNGLQLGFKTKQNNNPQTNTTKTKAL